MSATPLQQQNSSSPFNDALAIGAPLPHGTLRISRVIAQSNFAIIYTARDESLRREVAIKEFFPLGCRRDDRGHVLPPPLAAAEEFEATRTQFLEEARTLAQFHHPGVVAVHAFFKANNTAYTVMELLAGSTLRRLLEEKGRFSERETIELAHKIGDALEAVHRADLLHRDLKPDNIFMCDDGRLVLLDFGLSTKLELDVYGTRRLDAVARFGTPGYAPPEQYRQSAVQEISGDIYSLGATLYHLLTGAVPPTAPDRAFGTPLDCPSRAVPDVSPALGAALLRAMELEPSARPQSVGEFLQSLDQISALTLTRAAFLSLLRARKQQLENAPHLQQNSARLSTAQSTTKLLNEPEEGDPPADEGCLSIAFLVFLAVWLLAAVVCGAWFFVQYLSMSW